MEKGQKLRRLPENARVHKRPLLHSAITSPYAGAQHAKVVYVSASTPFMVGVKRVRKYLENIEKRGRQSQHTKQGTHSNKGSGVHSNNGSQGTEVVVIKATGKAVGKALDLALYFQSQPDCKVVIHTGSIGTVDDVEYEGEAEAEAEGGEEVPESQVRRTSGIEVRVSLREDSAV